jgi:cytochrome c-type biogenesis protein CcmH/NrfG
MLVLYALDFQAEAGREEDAQEETKTARFSE